MEKRGIDISRYQGKPDFAKLKNAVDFVILQAGFGRNASQKDGEFERNYAECKRFGIPVGVYWFSYAADPNDAQLEAYACMGVIKGKQFEYPIYFDIEGAACSGDVSEKCRRFCETLEKGGYFAGIYISRSPAQTYLDSQCINSYALWLAEYGGRLNWSGAVGMWQNSSTGRFPGIVGDVDTDICYVDYPAMIKTGGYNGYPKTAPKPMDSEVWYKRGDKDKNGDHSIREIKIRLQALGYSCDDTGGFGSGTEKAVRELQKSWGFEPTGEIGERFVKRLMK